MPISRCSRWWPGSTTPFRAPCCGSRTSTHACPPCTRRRRGGRGSPPISPRTGAFRSARKASSATTGTRRLGSDLRLERTILGTRRAQLADECSRHPDERPHVELRHRAEFSSLLADAEAEPPLMLGDEEGAENPVP